ncbi:MAG: hypothetical protein QXF45_00905 [Candidatus Caldarchaeum sp.]|uniref:PIN domain-containing protein n=1 Tax=Caldiarchaeum subterraneum TaxID=311458 RepID=A0A7C5YA59_CALS0
MKVLVDTSFLLLCVEKGKDFFSMLENKTAERIEPVVPSEVLSELKRLAAKRGKKSKMALAALQIAETMEKLAMEHEGSVDDALIYYAKKTNHPILTSDAKLMKKLASEKIEYLTVSSAGKPIVRLKFR